MKYFWDFVEYMIARELRQDDTIVRNYLVECDYLGTPITGVTSDCVFLRLALIRMGFKGSTSSVGVDLSEVLAALRSKGLTMHEYKIMEHLAHWYNYDRIKKGELKRWPKRASAV